MLQLPTIDEVSERVQSITDGHLPDLSAIEWPRLDLPSVDLGRTLDGAAASVGLRRRRRSLRGPLAIGAIVGATLAAWFMINRGALRRRFRDAADLVRARPADTKDTTADLDAQPGETLATGTYLVAPGSTTR